MDKKTNIGKIYKLCLDGVDIYVGSTKNKLYRRKAQHRYYCFNENNKSYNFKLYNIIRDKGINKMDFKDRIDIVWICDCPYNNKYELRAVEKKYILKLKTIGNTYTPYGKEWNIKEYNKDNKEYQKEYQKIYQNKYRNTSEMKKYQKEYHNKYNNQYYLNNKDKLLDKAKVYYLNNKDEKLNKAKEYRNNNKEKIKEYGKEYRNNNKEKIKEYRKNNKYKKKCIFCNKYILKAPSRWNRHINSNKHKKNLINFIEDFIDTKNSCLNPIENQV